MPRLLGAKKAENASDHFDSDDEDVYESEDDESQYAVIESADDESQYAVTESEDDEETSNIDGKLKYVNTSGKAGAQIPQLPLGDDSSPWGR
jgi:hypothetical protein